MPTIYHEYIGPDYRGAISVPADWGIDATETWGVVCYVMAANDGLTTVEVGFIEE